MRGKISLIWMPGTLVGIGVYGPRTSRGALGFMSHVSSWLGAPTSIRTMQFTSASAVTAPAAFSANRSESESPSRPRPPACRKSRLLMPSQKWTGLAASSWIIRLPSGGRRILHPTGEVDGRRRRCARGVARAAWAVWAGARSAPAIAGLLADHREKGLHVDEVLGAVRPEGFQECAAVRHQTDVGCCVRVCLVIPREAEAIDPLSGAGGFDVDEPVRPGQRGYNSRHGPGVRAGRYGSTRCQHASSGVAQRGERLDIVVFTREDPIEGGKVRTGGRVCRQAGGEGRELGLVEQRFPPRLHDSLGVVREW